MTEQDKEIFEKYCKLEEALRIAKDALRSYSERFRESNQIFKITNVETNQSFIFENDTNEATKALKQIDEVLK